MPKLGGAGRLGAARRGGGATELERRGGKGMDLTCGPHVSAREEREGESGEGHNPEGKAYSTGYTKGTWAAWARDMWGGLGRHAVNWASWARS
jgi:hypothetical protein